MRGRGEVWTNESWVFCGRWGAIPLSWRQSGGRSTTEMPEQRRVSTSVSKLCLLSAMVAPPCQLMKQSEVLALGRVVWPVFGGRRVQFRWRPWKPAASAWTKSWLQQEASGGHGGENLGTHRRVWVLDTLRPFSRTGWSRSPAQWNFFSTLISLS